MAKIDDYETVQKIDGRSFIYELETPSQLEQDRPLFWHYPNEWGPTGPGIGAFSAVRKGDWKLIYYHQNENFELFNIAVDIGEAKNLAATQSKKLKELAEDLTSFLKKVNAQMPSHQTTEKQVAWPNEK